MSEHNRIAACNPYSSFPTNRHSGTGEHLGRFTVRKNFVWTLSGNLVTGIHQASILCLIAKATSTETLGVYALSLAIINPIVAFCSLQLRPVLASDTDSRHPFRHYLIVRLISHLVAMALILLAALSRPSTLLLATLLPLTVWKLVVATSDLHYARMQRCERMDFVAKSQLLHSVGQLSLFAVALWATRQLEVACWFGAAAAFIVLIGYDRPACRNSLPNGRHSAARHFQFRPEIAAHWQLARTAIPLGCVTGVVALTACIPRYLLDHFHSTQQVGVFAALVCPGVLLQQCVTALSQAVLPRFARHYNANDTSGFRHLLNCVMVLNGCFGLLGIAAAVVIGSQLVTTLFGDELAAHGHVLVWIMVAFAVQALGACGAMLTASRRFHTQLIVAVATLTAAGVSGWLLIPNYGLEGAATSLVVVATVRLMAMGVAIRSVLGQLREDNDRMPAARPAA